MDRATQGLERLTPLLAGVTELGVGILRIDSAGCFDFATGLPSAWLGLTFQGRRPEEVLEPDLVERLHSAIGSLRTSRTTQRFDFDVSDDTETRTFEMRVTPDGQGAVLTLLDVTEARQRDNALAALLREVSHRSKNLLAIIQSVAMQTANNSHSTREFLDRFRGRLHALSGTQDLVTENDWRGTFLHTLIAAQLGRVGPSALAHMHVTGANPLLGPNAALHVGLAIHELATNAVQHGGLGDGGAGKVWVDAHYETGADEQPRLVVEWQETGTTIGKAKTPRFGSLLLQRIVPLSVGGEAKLLMTPDAVSYRLVVPTDQYSA